MAEFWSGLLVNGNAFRSSVQFNRPANTTPYAAGDVVGSDAGSVLTFDSIAPPGGMVQIATARLRMSGTALPAGMAGGFRLHLYRTAPAAIADNAPFAAVAGEMLAYMNYIDFPTLELIGGGFLTRTVSYIGEPHAFPADSGLLFGRLTTLAGNAFTPVSGATIEVVLLGLALGLT